ncbi:hypothetical protein ABC795_12020 [Blastococcus sp. HT6-30]|uniref:hypothetical protein n=1 Tax=Blastococcus sp. HT6-30 TaxID=3144843 RepID=UPI00321BC0B8
MRDLRGSLVRTTVAVLLGSAVLTGCAEKQEASTTLPTTEAAPTSGPPALGPADFPVPDEARTKDAAGAEAFLHYWIELLNRQRAIPSGDALRDLGPECQECLRIAHVYDEAAGSGRRFQGGDFSVESLGTPVIEDDEAVINFFAGQEAIALVDSAGATVENLPTGSHLGSGMRLAWSPDQQGWLVTGFAIG